MAEEVKKSGLGLPRNTAAALAYVLWWVTGIVFLLLEKDDKFIRFHAMQSIITFGGLSIIMMIPFVNILLFMPVMIVGIVLWLVLIIKAYKGEEFKLPVIGDFAKKQVEKI
jgi:uncharacterized membrane protein